MTYVNIAGHKSVESRMVEGPREEKTHGHCKTLLLRNCLNYLLCFMLCILSIALGLGADSHEETRVKSIKMNTPLFFCVSLSPCSPLGELLFIFQESIPL